MTMKERLRSRVAELTSIIGVSGHEWDVAKYIFDAIKDDVDTIEQLPNGIIVATKKGAHPGPRVMVSAHMDEVGYEVKSVSPQGYLYFDQIGGATIACLPGRRVLVKGETSKDGVLVDAEGYSYARYAAFAPDCGKLRLRDVPVHYEYPARAPEQKKNRKRKEPER